MNFCINYLIELSVIISFLGEKVSNHLQLLVRAFIRRITLTKSQQTCFFGIQIRLLISFNFTKILKNLIDWKIGRKAYSVTFINYLFYFNLSNSIFLLFLPQIFFLFENFSAHCWTLRKAIRICLCMIIWFTIHKLKYLEI